MNEFQNRVVRPFLSSSFKDLEKEREALAKHSFPKLSQFCYQRDVFFYPVDLRWGITAQESGTGKVIDICLQEVDKSRPYFIGIIGNRYGWHHTPGAESTDPLLTKTFEIAEKRYPFIQEYHNRSITELEIIYGAFLAPKEMKERSFFYFRSIDESEYKNEYERKMIEDLKYKIINEGFKVQNFGTPLQLADLVVEDLKSLIEKDFPIKDSTSPIEQEYQSQIVFARSRSQIYVGGKSSFETLDNYLENTEINPVKPLLVLGESGGGKTALMANYYFKLLKERPNICTIAFFIGSTPQSSSYIYLLQFILESLKQKLQLKESVPTDPSQLTPTLEAWIQLLAPPKDSSEKISLVLILDALNQLDPIGDSHELHWLPFTFPSHVRVILSTLPGRCLEVMKSRSTPKMTVQPLSPNDKRQVILEYLQQYSKGLSEEQLNTIVDASQTNNALFLRVLIDELRISANFEDLDNAISLYIKDAKNVQKLFEMVLDRWENDYGEEVVSKVYLFISLSFSGLSERELLDFLKISQQTLSSILLASQEAMVTRSQGLLGFFHDNLRAAVRSKYLPNLNRQNFYRFQLIQYFEELPETEQNFSRVLVELPYLYEQTKSFEKLKQFISREKVFDCLYSKTGTLELLRFWRLVGGYDLTVPEYSRLVDEKINQISTFTNEENSKDYEYTIKLLEKIASFFTECGKFSESIKVLHSTISIVKKAFGEEDYRLASLLLKLSTAMDYLCLDWTQETFQAIKIIEKVEGSNSFELVRPLVSYAYHTSKASNFQETIQELNRALDIISPVKNQYPEVYLYTHVTFAQVYLNHNEPQTSIDYYQKVYDLTHLMLGPKHKYISYSLQGIGTALRKMKKFDEGINYLKRAVEFSTSNFGEEHPNTSSCLFDLGKALKHDKCYQEAIDAFQKSCRIREKIFGPKAKKVANCWSEIAVCYEKLQMIEEAKDAKKRSDDIWDSYKNKTPKN